MRIAWCRANKWPIPDWYVCICEKRECTFKVYVCPEDLCTKPEYLGKTS